MAKEMKYSIGEISELTRISRRNIRYYVQLKLIPSPRGAGRGHYYTDTHLRGLNKIRDLKAYGYTLEKIGSRLKHPPPEASHVSLERLCDSKFYSVHVHENNHIGNNTESTTSRNEEDTQSLWRRCTITDGVELQVRGGEYRLNSSTIRKMRAALIQILSEQS